MIQEVPYGSPLYRLTLAFREEYLRRPLGLTNSDADLKAEDRQIHIAAVDNAKIIGTVVLKPISPQMVKLRQMAVAGSRLGSGLGAELVRFAEDLAWDRGYASIEMAARVSARGFYDKLGYRAEGDEFFEITIPHIRMVKAKPRTRR